MVCRDNGQQLGFLNSELAEDIAEKLDNGARIDAFLEEITGGYGDKKNLGANISLVVYRE